MPVAALLALTSACSFTVVGPPAKVAPGQRPLCDRSAGGRRAADIAGVFVTLPAAMIGLYTAAGDAENRAEQASGGVVMTVAMVAYVAALHHGSRKTRACTAALAQWEAQETVRLERQAKSAPVVAGAKADRERQIIMSLLPSGHPRATCLAVQLDPAPRAELRCFPDDAACEAEGAAIVAVHAGTVRLLTECYPVP